MQDLKIGLVQLNIVWENPKANREKLNELLKNTEADIIVLPEMFSTGFTMSPEGVAENSDQSASLSWMKQVAKDKQCAIIGSLAIEEKGQFYNRAYFVKEDGGVAFYNKRHLFSMAGEHKSYSSGEDHCRVNYKGWNIGLFICYDLRFPVWSRNDGTTDLYIYVANWPEVRVNAWESLLCARAIENQVYVVGVNRVGLDGNNIPYNGKSIVYDSKGTELAVCRDNSEEIREVSLSRDELNAFKKKFPVSNDADSFKLL